MTRGARAPLEGFEKIIKVAVDRGASDLHIKAGDVFRARIDGRLVPLTKQRLTPDQTRAIAMQLLPGDDTGRQLDGLTDHDCSWGKPGLGRFRVNMLRQRSSVMIVLRVIPFAVPTVADLGVPAALAEAARAERGLVLVAGLGGSGKSTTIAALVDHVNRHDARHVVTIESPIEYLHRDLHSSITQREVGVDTTSVAVGLRAALRQDPDMLVVGEVPDAETLDTALKAAETGRLVVVEMVAPDVVGALTRALAFFPPEEREIGRLRLAENLRAASAQLLLEREDDKPGRVGAWEVLPVDDAVRASLREADGAATVAGLLARPGDSGRVAFGAALEQLKTEGVIGADTHRIAAASVGTPAPTRRTRRSR